MTKQEIFNKVWDWFVTKGYPRSKDLQGACRYRGDNGTKCPVGVLIPDDLYTPMMEGAAASRACILITNYSTEGAKFVASLTEESNSAQLLSELQAVHDDGDRNEDMTRDLRQVAYMYKLSIPEEATT